jgi:catechol 2,3-dioxygenase-like lactoylglutathione lyase family enzyme
MLYMQEARMIDHIGFPVSDYERAKAFYLRALAPLGYSIVMEMSGDINPGGHPAAGFGEGGKPDFWIGGEGGLDKRFISRSSPRRARQSMRSTRQRWKLARATTARRDFARTIMRTITARSCSIPTATISRPCAIHRLKSAQAGTRSPDQDKELSPACAGMSGEKSRST